MKGQSRRHNVPVSRGYVHQPRNASVRADFIDFSVIWFCCVELAIDSNQAPPRSVWFEVVRIRMGHGMLGQECAEIGDLGGCAAARIHLNDLIASVQQSMRTACTSQQGVHSMVEEGNIRDT